MTLLFIPGDQPGPKLWIDFGGTLLAAHPILRIFITLLLRQTLRFVHATASSREKLATSFILVCFLFSQGTHLSKHGFRTVSSGSVKFLFNVVHQSRWFHSRPASYQWPTPLKTCSHGVCMLLCSAVRYLASKGLLSSPSPRGNVRKGKKNKSTYYQLCYYLYYCFYL